MGVDCAAEHLGGCTGSPTLHCGACGVVRYCSPAHQKKHWNEHKHVCERMAEQLQRAAALNDFPFTFTDEATRLVDVGEITSCSFLERRGLHGQQLWKSECECALKSSSIWGDFFFCEGNLSWHLPSSLCPCSDPESPLLAPLESWIDYYNWRRLPLESPVALLLHWPLTFYHALRMAATALKGNFKIRQDLSIHYLGPERELDQLQVFSELLALMPDTEISIDFIGPAVPASRDGDTLQLSTYAKCQTPACECKKPKNNVRKHITVRLWRGLYHDVQSKISRPDFVFAANAGIPAFLSWQPTIDLLIKLQVPTFFTDYCEEGCVLAVQCIDSMHPTRVAFPIQANPFKQPFIPWNKTIDLPMYSNCFLFGIH